MTNKFKSFNETTALKKLRTIHNEIIFTQPEVDKDIKTAQYLEEFFNLVVYNKTLSEENPIIKELNDEWLNTLRSSNKIKALAEIQTTNTKKGSVGEEGFAELLYQLIDKCTKGAIENSFESKAFIIGNKSATLMEGKQIEAINKTFQNKVSKELEQIFKKKSLRQYTMWDAKAGKIDLSTHIASSKITIENQDTPFLEELLNISASVKNYSDFSIHLENVNRKKAYLAIASKLYPDKTEPRLHFEYETYFSLSKGNEAINTHMSHLINLYALTGYGQVYIDKQAKEEIISQFANYLFYNNPSKQKIYVFSTKQIVNQLFNNKNSSSPFSQREKSNLTIETILNVRSLRKN